MIPFPKPAAPRPAISTTTAGPICSSRAIGTAPFLYRNNHDGTFADVTAERVFGRRAGPHSSGASWGDIDNDGDLDLYVTTSSTASGNHLYINDGAGHFAEETGARGAQLGGANVASISASLGDYDNDGYLDMYVARVAGLVGLHARSAAGPLAAQSRGRPAGLF